MMLRKRILVTGGAGFLGSHLCELFLSRGHEVICMDNFITGSARNVEHLFGRDGFRMPPAAVGRKPWLDSVPAASPY